MLKSRNFRIAVRSWWPVIVWLGVIRLESTDFASANNTAGLLYSIVSFFYRSVDVQLVDAVDAVLRKCGHFIGYAILSALVFYALRKNYRLRIAPHLTRDWGTYLRDLWRWEWVLLAMGVTIITASLDEIHQTFIASRTGRWQDVVIDSSGAVLVQVLIYLWSLRTLSGRQQRIPQPELSSTP